MFGRGPWRTDSGTAGGPRARARTHTNARRRADTRKRAHPRTHAPAPAPERARARARRERLNRSPASRARAPRARTWTVAGRAKRPHALRARRRAGPCRRRRPAYLRCLWCSHARVASSDRRREAGGGLLSQSIPLRNEAGDNALSRPPGAVDCFSSPAAGLAHARARPRSHQRPRQDSEGRGLTLSSVQP
jgi:hypothetical protein